MIILIDLKWDNNLDAELESLKIIVLLDLFLYCMAHALENDVGFKLKHNIVSWRCNWEKINNQS